MAKSRRIVDVDHPAPRWSFFQPGLDARVLYLVLGAVPENGTGTREDEQRREMMKNTIAVKDPVCGMDIETATAAGRSEYKGQTYYFCGSKCKEKFDLKPEQYLGKSAETAKSGHGCCS